MNPYLIIAALVAVMSAGWGGFRLGLYLGQAGQYGLGVGAHHQWPAIGLAVDVQTHALQVANLCGVGAYPLAQVVDLDIGKPWRHGANVSPALLVQQSQTPCSLIGKPRMLQYGAR